MKTTVLKFGGASVATPAHFGAIADIIIARKRVVPRVVVVVSAMGHTTDDLLTLAKQVHPNPPQRELDMLVSVGERISIALLAMALDKKGAQAVSFTGSQSGIITDPAHGEAKIVDVRPGRILEVLEAGKIAIVAGFQGVSQHGRDITTLGRGGSDTTAVALGIALGAECVEFYKDVPGIFSEDPKKNPNAAHYDLMSYEEALAVVNRGAKVLHSRCIQLAEQNNLPLQVRSFDLFPNNEGTFIGALGATRTVPSTYERSAAMVSAP